MKIAASCPWLVFLAVLGGCQTGGKKSEHTEAPQAKSKEAEEEEHSPAASLERQTFLNSLSNNPFTSHTVNRSKAADLAASLEKGGRDGKNAEANLAAAISAHRLAGKGPQESLGAARGVADAEMRRNIERSLPEAVRLDLALSGINNGKLAFAEYYLDQLVKSKNPKIKAAAHNAMGVVALKVGRIPEAILEFKEALKTDGEYRAARINLGFIALDAGDLATAKRAFGGLNEDWFIQSALLVVHRLEGEADRAAALCEKVLEKKPTHKPTLLNCALNEAQGKRNFPKAKEYLGKYMKTPGGSAVMDERAAKLQGHIEEESRAAKKDEKPAPKEAPKAQQPAAAPQKNGGG